MRRLSLVFALASLVTGAPAFADAIPYGSPGTIASTVALTAASNGVITGYFAGANAADTDYVRLVNVTAGWTSANFFNNQTTATGASQVFGTVSAGDVLVFELYNQTTGDVFGTDPSYSSDGVNHGYVTAFSGDGTIPSGIYIGMEDLPVKGGDFDYNDDTFVFTNVSTTRALETIHAPAPASLLLLGTGVLGAAGIVRRRAFSR